MPSITWWNRVEPRPRTDDVTGPLRAAVRDPLWFLTRQWQLGEFRGVDSGSPAWVTLSERTTPLLTWEAPSGPAIPLRSAPIEEQVAREPFAPDLSLRLELGQVLSRLLGEAGAADQAFVAQYPVADALDDPTDTVEVSLRRACAGRTIDGVGAYQAIKGTLAGLPAAPAGVFEAFVGWVEGAVGPLGDVKDAPSWQPARLEYAATVRASGSAFDVRPDDRGVMEWSAFDLQAPPPASASTSSTSPPPPPAPAASRSIIPAHVRFKGMPNPRFWDFEDGTLDFGDLKPDKRDLARLALMEFMLLQSNDWFMLPVDVPVGSLYALDSLIVRDVFGTDTLVTRADRETIGQSSWRMFSTSVAGGGTGDFFLVPPSAGGTLRASRPFEEIRFARDEMANMVWGIENILPDAAGEPWPQRERDSAVNAQPVPATSTTAGLTYQIASSVPASWIPFLPVSLDPTKGTVALELAAALGPDGHTPISPRGRILQPTGISPGAPYQLPEEEVPRNGLRVQRVFCRSRWIDGSTHLWQLRRVEPGTGETSSALRFDQALLVEQG